MSTAAVRPTTVKVRSAAALAAALVASAGLATAQDMRRPPPPAPGAPLAPVVMPSAQGAVALGPLLQSLGTTGRVLMIAAHPDDEDTPLLAWLARGRHVETAYLSLTRGDGGQNLIGNELGEALGAIRTEELLAARRLDGARQYFTRAYDFGFSKDAEETFTQWERDSVLADVVQVVRAFRPHVIVSVFSGTPRDGHGHHRAAGQLAREAYDRSADTVAFPVATFGPSWTVEKFYRGARFTPDEMTLKENVGEYSAIAGRSYAEVAAESRSQHKSQGFGALQRKGVQMAYLRREDTRAEAPEEPRTESSIFDGVDTTWARLVPRAPDARSRAALDSANQLFALVRDRYRADNPATVVAPLAQIVALLRSAREPITAERSPGLWDAITLTEQRAEQALILAAGVAVEATAQRQVIPAFDPVKRDAADTLTVAMAVFNRGQLPLVVSGVRTGGRALADSTSTLLVPDSAMRVPVVMRGRQLSAPWWRALGRSGAAFRMPIDGRDEAERQRDGALAATVLLEIAGAPVELWAPVVYRFADPVKGDQQIPVAVVPGITLGLDRVVEYVRADVPTARQLRVRVQSAYPTEERVTVSLRLPPGLTADSVERTVTVRPNETVGVLFNLRGTLGPGRHELGAVALHQGSGATSGYYTISYDHITPQRIYAPSGMFLSAVDVALPPRARVGYVEGVGDAGKAALEQLGVAVELLNDEALAAADLSRFSAIVVGPRAYQSNTVLVNNNARLLEFAQRGGTLVVQYGQYEMQQPGIMPYPIQLSRPAARVTREDAVVTVLNAASPLLRYPNRLGPDDWTGWVQERALYMPSSADGNYAPVIAMNDPDEPANSGGILSVPYGRGMYVYTTLALFRQLPNGVPGAARLLVNLISARPPGAARSPRSELP